MRGKCIDVTDRQEAVGGFGRDGQSLGAVFICNASMGKMRYAAIP